MYISYYLCIALEFPSKLVLCLEENLSQKKKGRVHREFSRSPGGLVQSQERDKGVCAPGTNFKGVPKSSLELFNNNNTPYSNILKNCTLLRVPNHNGMTLIGFKSNKDIIFYATCRIIIHFQSGTQDRLDWSLMLYFNNDNHSIFYIIMY